MRLILAAVCCIAGGAAATFLISSERQLAERRVPAAAFDRHTSETIEALADVRAAQQAYVAAGQSVAFWTSQVDTRMDAVASTLTVLQQSATSTTAKAALDEAGSILHEFGEVDARIRDYIRSGAQLMAADVIFTEGNETAVRAARQVERARLDEHQYLDHLETARRNQEGAAMAGAAGLTLLIVTALARSPRRAVTHADAPASSLVAPRTVAPSTAAAAGTLRERHAAPPELERAEPEQNKPKQAVPAPAVRNPPIPNPAVPDPAVMAQSVDGSRRAAAPALKAAAQLCTELGRVSDSQELQSLIGRAADMLEASGLVLWMGTEAGDELRPAVAHGYDPQMVARIPPVSRSANNAAAAAYRTATLQIVLSRPGSARGALVAPMVSADGCIGVLSAEIRDGGEASETVQALAAIIAAQLAGVLASTPPPNRNRSAGTAAM